MGNGPYMTHVERDGELVAVMRYGECPDEDGFYPVREGHEDVGTGEDVDCGPDEIPFAEYAGATLAAIREEMAGKNKSDVW